MWSNLRCSQQGKVQWTCAVAQALSSVFSCVTPSFWAWSLEVDWVLIHLIRLEPLLEQSIEESLSSLRLRWSASLMKKSFPFKSRIPSLSNSIVLILSEHRLFDLPMWAFHGSSHMFLLCTSISWSCSLCDLISILESLLWVTSLFFSVSHLRQPSLLRAYGLILYVARDAVLQVPSFCYIDLSHVPK